ncbi:MAG TPA: MFS transporter [Rhodocyclaceae bacterium]|jgi:PPP family 3-phenylpropionic acid transporter
MSTLSISPPQRLAAWYFCYFAFLGAFVTYFGLYLQGVGMSGWEIGILLSIHSVLRLAAPLFWGWWADRRNARAATVKVTMVVSLAIFSLLFLAHGFWTFFILLTLLSFFWTATLPLVEALTLAHLQHRIERYGRIRLWGSIGFIFAVQGVGIWLDVFSVSSLLWVCIIILGGNWVTSMMLSETQAGAVSHSSGSLRDILGQVRVMALLGGCFLMSAAHAPLYVFYSIHLVDNGYSKTAVGALWALGVVAEIFVFLAMPRLLGRYSLRLILSASFALAVLRFLLIGWGIASVPVAIAAQILHGATFGACHASAMAALNRWFAAHHQGRAQSLYSSLSFGGGSVLGGLVSGYGWEHWGAGPTYSLAALFALLGGLVVLRGLERE